MVTVKKLIELLQDYNPDAEVILPNGEEIKHIGMANISKNSYDVILAHDKVNRID